MIPKEITERIHEMYAREQESAEAYQKIDNAESAREAEMLTEELDYELANLEADILAWVEGQPEFADPDPENPEKTPGYFHVAADVLRRHMGWEPFLFRLADRWENFTWNDVVGY